MSSVSFLSSETLGKGYKQRNGDGDYLNRTGISGVKDVAYLITEKSLFADKKSIQKRQSNWRCHSEEQDLGQQYVGPEILELLKNSLLPIYNHCIVVSHILAHGSFLQCDWINDSTINYLLHDIV